MILSGEPVVEVEGVLQPVRGELADVGGVFGVDAGTPIINPGESAILCFGATKRQPWVVTDARGGESLEIRDVCTLFGHGSAGAPAPQASMAPQPRSWYRSIRSSAGSSGSACARMRRASDRTSLSASSSRCSG